MALKMHKIRQNCRPICQTGNRIAFRELNLFSFMCMVKGVGHNSKYIENEVNLDSDSQNGFLAVYSWVTAVWRHYRLQLGHRSVAPLPSTAGSPQCGATTVYSWVTAVWRHYRLQLGHRSVARRAGTGSNSPVHRS